MKILLISCRYYPEPFTITNIAEELYNLGNDITVLTGRPNSGKWKIYDGYKKIKYEIINGVKIIRLREIPRKKGFFGLLINYLSICRMYDKWLKKFKGDFDVVLSHGLSPVLSLRSVNKYCKKKNINHVHYGLDLWPESFVAAGYLKKDSLLFKYIKKQSIKIYSSCSLIAFASPSTEQYFKNYLKVNVPFRHIYQPCLSELPDYNYIFPISVNSDNKVHLLYCGTIARFIHLDLIINAFNDKKIRENIVLDIVGSGSDEENIRNVVSDLKLKNVVFHGRVDPSETKLFYKNCSAIFIPLFNNSATSLMIPQKVIESFVYGRPIIGMIAGDGRDLINKASSKNILVDQTVESIREGLYRLLNMSRNELEECGKENRYFFEKHPEFTTKVVSKEINDLLFNYCSNK